MSELKHPNEMTRDELRELVGAISWQALDLAQHLNFTIHMLKPEYVADALDAATAMAYRLSHYPYSQERINPEARVQIAVFGEKGLSIERMDEIGDLFPVAEDCAD